MRGRWWGLAVLLAATTLAVSANPTSRASSGSDSVTIPLILRQPGAKQTPKKAEPPKKEEPKSPQDILEEAKPTPVAMQATETPMNVPSLEAPPAPTLDPALPATPELFVPDLMVPLPQPKAVGTESKPQPQPAERKAQPPSRLNTPLPATVPPPPPAPIDLAAEPQTSAPAPIEKPAPKPRSVEMQPVEDVKPRSVRESSDALPPPPAPQEEPSKPRTVEMQPVEDVKPRSAREGSGALPPPPVPQEKPSKPRTVEMQPVEDFKSGTLRAARDGKPPSFRCFVRDVMAFYDRTHVRCYNKVQGKVYYFAVDTNQPVAETVMTKALAAMKSGKPLTIVFAPGTDLNPSNCGKKDCRRLIDVEN